MIDYPLIAEAAAHLIVGGSIGCLIGMYINFKDILRWRNRWQEEKGRAAFLADANECLDILARQQSKQLAKYEADEERRLAPLKAANRKRHEEALARKGVA